MRFISSKDRPNPSPGELKQAKKPSRKILDSRRGSDPLILLYKDLLYKDLLYEDLSGLASGMVSGTFYDE